MNKLHNSYIFLTKLIQLENTITGVTITSNWLKAKMLTGGNSKDSFLFIKEIKMTLEKVWITH